MTVEVLANCTELQTARADFPAATGARHTGFSVLTARTCHHGPAHAHPDPNHGRRRDPPDGEKSSRVQRSRVVQGSSAPGPHLGA